jgi:hypothetical protein
VCEKYKFNYHLKVGPGPSPCVSLQKKKFTLCTKLCKARLGFFSSGLGFFSTESIHLKVQNYENYKTWIVLFNSISSETYSLSNENMRICLTTSNIHMEDLQKKSKRLGT